MQLYCFGESGNAYKAALTLELAGVPWEPVFVDFFRGGARAPEYRALNPMGEVPVLVDGDTVLTQSGVIQDYIIEKTGRFGGANPTERREVWRWVLFDNHKVSGVAGPLRFNRNFLPVEKRDEAVSAFLEMRLRSALAVLDARLDGRDWLAAPEPTVADFSCCGYLYYPEPYGFDRAAYPAIDAWLDRIAALPGWKHPYDLMPGRPSDREGARP
ncbi:glutathione S-transferase family protein [Roseitranquillus sediminis]|uniref:glutathione S-transferase family protein n=1 Tax=Roseitranquillus sediminis TaxID=2809051 RepID=UPI001D0C8F3A|nr:glutathione S-transferase family protein [Roseitranquillus sediminis]MBM9594640.1 glutathione S-transferase family protein [Roseitranquillus sediminis]